MEKIAQRYTTVIYPVGFKVRDDIGLTMSEKLRVLDAAIVNPGTMNMYIERNNREVER